MSKYRMEVRRIVRESLTVEVEADSPEEARQQAKAAGNYEWDNPDWDCYDCDVWVDDWDEPELVADPGPGI
jgi:hypothetical protein